MNKNLNGFSLLELLIVVAILSIIAVAGSSFYRNFGKTVVLSSSAQMIASDLKQVRSNSMIGNGGLLWGVHFVNSTNDYYELFSTPTDYSNGAKSVVVTNYLPAGVTFSDPTEGNTKDIIFSKITGNSNTATVSVASEGNTQTVNVTIIGTIY